MLCTEDTVDTEEIILRQKRRFNGAATPRPDTERPALSKAVVSTFASYIEGNIQQRSDR